jgi:hypothetical protein
MGIFESLFGGTSNPTTTTTSETQLSPQVQQLIASLNLNQSAPTQFQGPTVAGLTPDELQAQEMARAAAASQNQLAGQANTTQAKMLDPNFQLNVADNPYLQAANQVTTADLTKNLMERILPQVRNSGEQAGGAYSSASSRNNLLEARGIGDTQDSIADAITKAQYDAYNQGAGRLQTAIGQNAGVQAGNNVGATTLGGVGAQNRALEQAQMDENQKAHYLMPLLNQEWLNNQLGVASTLNGMTGKTVNTQIGATPKAGSKLGKVASSAASGAALGSAIPGVGTAVGAIGGGILGLLT